MVIVLTKAEPDEGNTGYAQGGIAAAVGPDDSPELHAADTLAAGDGLCDERAVEVLVEDGPRLRPRVDGVGRGFDRGADGQLALGIEAAHSVRRVLHARDATGREIGRVLSAHVGHARGVRHDAHAASSTWSSRAAVTGVRFLATRALGVATGAAGAACDGRRRHVFRDTTNPAVATGDGWRWRSAQARASPIWSSCSSIRRR